jgi:hypothetical protein
MRVIQQQNQDADTDDQSTSTQQHLAMTIHQFISLNFHPYAV